MPLWARTIGNPKAETTMQAVTKMQTSIRALLDSTDSPNLRDIRHGIGDKK